MTEFTPEMIEQARAAESVEALLALAKENGIEDFTEESAKAYFDLLHPTTGEVSDDELENVSGGGCYNKGRLVVTTYTRACENGYMCKHCHKDYQVLGSYDYEGYATKGLYTVHKCSAKGYEITNWCSTCYYMINSKGLYLCTNPKKAKH